MITQRLSSIEVEKELEKSKIVAGYKLQREEAKALVKSMRAQVERLTQELASAKYEYQKAEFKLNSVNDIMQQRRFLVSGHDLEQNKAKALAEELEKANKQVASLLNELDEVKHENLKLQRSYSRLEAEAQARRQRDEKAESERQAEESSISKKYQEQMRELRALV
jgi:chromosome segregation ATPase